MIGGVPSQFYRTDVSSDRSQLCVRPCLYENRIWRISLKPPDFWLCGVVALGHLFGLSSQQILIRWLIPANDDTSDRIDQIDLKTDNRAIWACCDLAISSVLDWNSSDSIEDKFRRDLCGFSCISTELKSSELISGGDEIMAAVGPDTASVVHSTMAFTNEISRFQHHFPIVSVSCGKSHSLLLDSAGQILSFGEGSRGALGNGSTHSNYLSPNVVEKLAGLKVKSIAAGGWHSCAITEFGDLYCWGWNESGQLGLNPVKTITELEPMLIEISNCQTLHVVQISCGSRHTAILTDSRQVLTAGWNGYGQLGRNGSPFEFLPACTTSYIANILCSGWQTICTLTAY